MLILIALILVALVLGVLALLQGRPVKLTLFRGLLDFEAGTLIGINKNPPLRLANLAAYRRRHSAIYKPGASAP